MDIGHNHWCAIALLWSVLQVLVWILINYDYVVARNQFDGILTVDRTWNASSIVMYSLFNAQFLLCFSPCVYDSVLSLFEFFL